MKKNNLFFGVTAGLFTFLGVAMAANFSDITGHWAEKDLVWAVNSGLLKGDDVAVGEVKNLRPNDSVSRAELATILKRYDTLLQSGQNISTDDTDVFKTTIDGITWIGREIKKEDESTMYRAIKIDAQGNESVIYEVTFNTLGGDVQWNFSNEGRNLIITVSKSTGDAIYYTEIGFEDGKETIRSHHSTNATKLTFTLPNLSENSVEYVTSNLCGNNMEVELLGVKISSGNDSETFSLAEPEMVSCTTEREPYPLQDVVTTPHGLYFHLPNGDKAQISISEKDQKISVYFEPVRF